ncbi:heat shock protein HslJ [Leucobacter luti]|uniref:Heat shock protein HslJ n=1 Tax=Leucobacter luti TaxID=340320 RepID=A0A4R6S425_9MICO|nr:META domain-containing protein [Leucobacter luti]TDP94381.1 heat shock protein HslJ [Leucobacter luti]
MKIQLRAAGALIATASVLGLAACSASASPVDTAAAVAGAWGAPAETKGEPSLEFTPTEGKAGGEYGGNDGCNVLGGSYTVKDDVIEFGVMRSTMMFCEGVDTWLSQAHTATMDGKTLTVLDEQGKQIGTLQRPAKAS